MASIFISVISVISVINRNQCNQPELPQRPEPAQRRDALNSAPSDDETPKKELGATPVVNTARCPHHPHARWVRFDPSGQAWCDKMDCWDCYRLMKIGEVLGYQQLSGCMSTIGQGIEAWSSFVASQRSFAIVIATQQAIVLCETSGVEVPDLSVDVKRLVSTG